MEEQVLHLVIVVMAKQEEVVEVQELTGLTVCLSLQEVQKAQAVL